LVDAEDGFLDSTVGYFTLALSKINLALRAKLASYSTVFAKPSIEQAKKRLLLSENELTRKVEITEFFSFFLLWANFIFLK